jgi:DNA-binding GntR family transcriptional regulator
MGVAPMTAARARHADDREPLRLIPRATLRSQIADSLRHAIIRGDVPAGSPVTEIELARRFGVSRGPLREAMSQLVQEGLLVTVPYSGTRVVSLSIDDIDEIYSMRTALETLAFQQAWNRRDAAFRREIEARHDSLLRTFDHEDRLESTEAELRLHSLVYEACGHRLLLETWSRIAGRLQLYLAMHQRAHGRSAPLLDAHVRYVRLAQGDDLELMLDEVRSHMRRGVEPLKSFVVSST